MNTIIKYKNLLITISVSLLLFQSCESNTIGKYQKEQLPVDFKYTIIEDKCDESLDKNQLTVEINKKISVEQIATLAERLFATKPKQKKFFIFYLLPNMKSGAGAWAISHFDPELEIEIIGSSTVEDSASNKLIDLKVDGDIIGKWYEEQYTASTFVIFKKGKKTFLKTIFKNGQYSDDELKEKKGKNGTRFDYMEGGYNGEYFILNLESNLELYNKENKNFTTASKK